MQHTATQLKSQHLGTGGDRTRSSSSTSAINEIEVNQSYMKLSEKKKRKEGRELCCSLSPFILYFTQFELITAIHI